MATPLSLSAPSADGLLYWCGVLRRCATLEEAAQRLQEACGPACLLVRIHRADRLVAHVGDKDGVAALLRLGGPMPGGESFAIELGLTQSDPAEEELQVLGHAVAWGLGHRGDELLEALERLAESQRREGARHARTSFLISVSHELRTPLNAIIGFSELLAQGKLGELNPKQARYVSNVVSSARLLLGTVNDLLDLANPLTLERASVDLAAVAAQVAEGHDQVAVEGTATAWADEARVRQILRHLIGNAIKFSPTGGRVVVKLTPGATVAVIDSGPGMTEEERQRVLEPFEQARSGYAREASGAGLGLALVCRLVELHGGTLRLDSEPGKGTQVTFTLPGEGTSP